MSLRTTCPDSQLVKLDLKSWTATLIPNTKWFACSDKYQMKTPNPHKVELFIWWLWHFCFKKGRKNLLGYIFQVWNGLQQKKMLFTQILLKSEWNNKNIYLCISPIIDPKTKTKLQPVCQSISSQISHTKPVEISFIQSPMPWDPPQWPMR